MGRCPVWCRKSLAIFCGSANPDHEKHHETSSSNNLTQILTTSKTSVPMALCAKIPFTRCLMTRVATLYRRRTSRPPWSSRTGAEKSGRHGRLALGIFGGRHPQNAEHLAGGRREPPAENCRGVRLRCIYGLQVKNRFQLA